MRSSHSLAALGIVIALAACGSDTAPPDDSPNNCATSFLDYDNFGAPFLLDWCTGCHSAAVPDGMRQDAPLDVNFDSPTSVRQYADRIAIRAAGPPAPTMPPAGGPSDEERALLAAWIACGAP